MVVDNGTSSNYVTAFHADDEAPWLAGFYNDTYSTATPIFEYYGKNTGEFTMGTHDNKDFSFYTNGFVNPRLTITATGDVGIGTIIPTAQLHTTGTVRFQNFGAGTLVTDANGNVSVSSDERLKNIQGVFDRGLEELMNINPIEYKWKKKTGYDTENSYYGFSAQNVKLSIPEAVGEDNRGYLTLSDRPILATAINAIKELNQKQEDQTLSIQANTLQTTTNISTLGELQTSVDENLAVINQTLTQLDDSQAELEESVTGNTGNLASLSESINSLTDLTTILTDTINIITNDIDNHEARIAQLEAILTEGGIDIEDLTNNENPQTPALENIPESLETLAANLTVIQEEDTDEDGNIISKQIFSLSGDLIVERLKARKIEAEEIEVAGIVIRADISSNSDGAEDTQSSATAGNGAIEVGQNNVLILTSAVEDTDRVFITPRVLTDRNIAVTRVDNGQGFVVETIGEVTEDEGDIKFDWLIIGK